MHYPLIHESNQRPYHFIHGYAQFLDQQLAYPSRFGRSKGIFICLTMNAASAAWSRSGVPRTIGSSSPAANTISRRSGGTRQAIRAVVDHFAGRIQFVQVGEEGTGTRAFAA